MSDTFHIVLLVSHLIHCYHKNINYNSFNTITSIVWRVELFNVALFARSFAHNLPKNDYKLFPL